MTNLQDIVKKIEIQNLKEKQREELFGLIKAINDNQIILAQKLEELTKKEIKVESPIVNVPAPIVNLDIPKTIDINKPKWWKEVDFTLILQKLEQIYGKEQVIKDYSNDLIDIKDFLAKILMALLQKRENRPLLRGGINTVSNETPTGTIDGANTVFTLAYTPKENSLKLFVGGGRQKGGGEDYTLSGITITFNFAPSAGAVILADYERN